jgi:hypothetical protein
VDGISFRCCLGVIGMCGRHLIFQSILLGDRKALFEACRRNECHSVKTAGSPRPWLAECSLKSALKPDGSDERSPRWPQRPLALCLKPFE